jgi:hypothetical protein
MMQQLNIEYFFPLTEQIPLELDFKPCTDYAEEQRKMYRRLYWLYFEYWWNGVGTWLDLPLSTNLGSPSFDY